MEITDLTVHELQEKLKNKEYYQNGLFNLWDC